MLDLIAEIPTQSKTDGGALDAFTAFLTTILMMIGGAIAWGVKVWITYRENQRRERLEDEARANEIEESKEKTIIDHLQALCKRLEQENDDLQKEVSDLRKEFFAVTAHMAYLEGLMERRGIKFNRYIPPSFPGGKSSGSNQTQGQSTGSGGDVETHGPRKSLPQMELRDSEGTSSEAGDSK